MKRYKIGVQFHPQHTTWASLSTGVQQADDLGVDSIWTWDHFYPLYGEPDGAHFECYSMLAAFAVQTRNARLGAMVTCNTYRNPNLLADMARTIDHISGGRFILGIGAGWFQRDYEQYGYEFGTAKDRLSTLDENLPVILRRWQVLNPPPVNGKIPILIGGGGEKKTLRMVAQYADMWNLVGKPGEFKQKNDVLDNWCQKLGRNPNEVERTVLITDLSDLDVLDDYVQAGAEHLILGLSEPWDFTAVEKTLEWRDRLSG
jgi:probable F420-dependent oxidoreductase